MLSAPTWNASYISLFAHGPPIFKVKVMKINTSIQRGKIKSFKGSYGFKKDTKKAIVTLAEGNTIDSSLEIKWL